MKFKIIDEATLSIKLSKMPKNIFKTKKNKPKIKKRIKEINKQLKGKT